MKRFIILLMFLLPGYIYAQRANTDNIIIIQQITDLLANNYKVFYSNGSGEIIELSLGADGTILKSNGASAAPTFSTFQLSDLSDVGVTTPTNKNVLVADGDSWESRALVEADISDLGTYLTGNESITLSGDVSGSGATSITVTIASDAIEESMLKAVNGPTDEYYLTYEETTGDFEWQAGGGSVSFGTDNQIPYTNSGGDDFDYSAGLIFDGTNLTTTGTAAATTGLFSDLTDNYIPYHVSDASGLDDAPFITDGSTYMSNTDGVFLRLYESGHSSQDYFKIGSFSSEDFEMGYSSNATSEATTGYLRFETDNGVLITNLYFQPARYLDSDGEPGTSGQYLSSTGTGSNWVTPASDWRKKKDFRPISMAKAKLFTLQGYEFNWKKDYPKKAEDIPYNLKISKDYEPRESGGVIAQDVEKIIPEAILRDNTGYLGVNYDVLVAYLIEAMKEQQEEINTLSWQISKLIERINK